MAEIFVTSDTHFNHDNIIKYCGRPFANAEEMDEQMVKNWNSVITPQDKVYHLGDVYMGGKREYIDTLLGRLNGKKRLILGNHDNGKDQLLHKHFQKIDIWRMFPEFGLILTHIPVNPFCLDRREGGEVIYSLSNIHGHIHDEFVEVNGIVDERYYNVCVEHTNYTPVNIEQLRVK